MRTLALCSLFLLNLAAGCDDADEAPADAAPAPDTEAPAADAARDAADLDAAAAMDATTAADAGAADDAAVDAEAPLPDLGAPDPAWQMPEPAPYRVGAARIRMPVAVGMPTSGFGQPQADGPSVTPYAEYYPGTTSVHLHPDIRVVVFEAGDGNRLYLLRADTIGVSAFIRASLLARLVPRYGEQVDQQLVIAATHTHAGPGRLIDKPYWHLIQDHFMPEHYNRMVEAMEAAVVAAVDDLEPARVGHGLARTTELHSDRRCSNPEEEEPELPIVRIDRPDGETKAVVLFHAVHPTVLGINTLALSQDVTGGIEAKVAERFDHPVQVIFFNGAAADMGPGNPRIPPQEGAAEWPGDFNRIEAIGEAAADAVMAALPMIETEAEGVVHARTVRAPIDREALGYEDGEFPHQHGAVYCGVGADEACLGEELPTARSLEACIPFPTPESAAPKQVPMTAARVGERLFVTTPGEFAIALGRRVRESVAAMTPFDDVTVIGYAQEYTGYSLPEDDWRHGGYESSGALWGPRQGDYLTAQVIETAVAFVEADHPSFREPPPTEAPGPYVLERRDTLRSAGEPAVLADVPAAVGPADVVMFGFAGGDPWPGNPVVTLEREVADGEFEAVRTPDGRALNSDGYAMTLHLEPDPPYAEEADARVFGWSVRLPVRRPVPGAASLSPGRYRFAARGPAHVLAAEAPIDYTLFSGVFEVSE